MSIAHVGSNPASASEFKLCNETIAQLVEQETFDFLIRVQIAVVSEKNLLRWKGCL